MPSNFTVAALYHFTPLENLNEFKQQLLAICQHGEIKGTILLASEGINGTICGPQADIDQLLTLFKEDSCFEGMSIKFSYSTQQTFLRLKIKLKKEIVTLCQPHVDPTEVVGKYIEPKDWNALIQDPEVLVLDTRNHYETQIGSFEGAIDPNTTNFREFPDYVKSQLDPKKHKKVAMFCTGGIRCEKASSYMLNEGFAEVYHLKGGILKYIEEVEQKDSLWQGECFVFDERVSVEHNLKPGTHSQCFGCRRPLSEADRQSPHYQVGICCPFCHSETTDEQKQRFAERQKQIKIAKARGHAHRHQLAKRK